MRLNRCLTICCLAAAPLPACAHPMGNFTINHYSRLTVASRALSVHFVLDMAELPTLSERQDMDKDDNGVVSDAEARAYVRSRMRRWLDGLEATMDGRRVAWSVKRARIVFTPGVANLYVMRMELDLAMPLAPGKHLVTYDDRTYPERPGWKELVVRTATGVGKPVGNVPTVEISRELRSYPAGLLSKPPQVAGTRFEISIPRPAARKMPSKSRPPISRAGRRR